MAAPGPASLQRRLQSSQEARHRQAVLVRKLQAKVLQYRTRCRELEQQLEAGAGCLPGRWEGTEALEKALLEVKEEQQRCEDLAEANSLLREHLEKAKEVNSALKEDVGKLTVDWMRAREELEAKEREWRQERELYENYFRGDRDRLLGLWHQMVTFRRHFLEMKTATNRDLSELKAEQTRLSGSVMANCSRLNCSVMSFQAKGELEKKELQDRLKDLVALEDKHCVLQHELVVAREALEESHLERDVLKEEKHELRVALEKLEQENEALLCKVDEMERAKISAQEKLSLCERTKSELCAEKGHLEQLLKKAEEQQEELRVELGVLAEEKEEAQEKLLEVRPKTWCFWVGMWLLGWVKLCVLASFLASGFPPARVVSQWPGAVAPGVLSPRARAGRGVRREGVAGAGEGCPGGATGSPGAGETRPFGAAGRGQVREGDPGMQPVGGSAALV
ncbi:uncharacterized protein LOC141750420 isoform X2 [Larus michahellis]|uniref:uncharacterized protein LOC141750420 isoform X2 n=1 Tax=Larus michahellis TaxID=119627 RepID=UPI003D9BD131